MPAKRNRIACGAACALLGALALLTPPAPAGATEIEDLRAEVEMLSHDLAGVREQVWSGPRLNGYYVFEYLTDNEGQSPSTFRQHILSLFLARNWDRWRVFSELEYEDGTELEGDGTTVEGHGAVVMEVGWFEYRSHDALVIRGGKFLLPEYWNVNHYAPVVLSTTRPLMVRNVFPTDTVGLMAHGKLFSGTTGLSYALYTGNGQSAGATDDNDNKAVGGVVTAHLASLLRAVSRLDLGATFHSERSASVGGSFDAVGGELQVNTTRYELLAEYATRQANPDAEGFYVQPSARLFGEVRGFYRYDYLDDGTNPRTRQTVGLNWRPMANVSLKIEAMTNDFANPGRESFDELATSVALFF